MTIVLNLSQKNLPILSFWVWPRSWKLHHLKELVTHLLFILYGNYVLQSRSSSGLLARSFQVAAGQLIFTLRNASRLQPVNLSSLSGHARFQSHSELAFMLLYEELVRESQGNKKLWGNLETESLWCGQQVPWTIYRIESLLTGGPVILARRKFEWAHSALQVVAFSIPLGFECSNLDGIRVLGFSQGQGEAARVK